MRARLFTMIPLASLAVLLCAGAGKAGAQGVDLGYPATDSAYYGGASSALPSGNVWMTAESSDDLGTRVADLEATLKKMKDKEAADKKSAAGKPTIKVGGRVQVDWADFSQNATSILQAGDFDSGTEFRRARIGVSGDAFYIIDYKFEVDFAGSTSVRNSDGTDSTTIQQTTFKDVYITIKELPVLGNVRIGHYKVPFSLEELTSAKYITFMERSLATENIVAGRNTGIMAFDHNEAETFTWAVGAFASQMADNPPIFKNDNGGTSAIGRITYLPWYDEATAGRGVFHTGLSYAYLDIADGDSVRMRQRPESHIADRVVDAGSMADVTSLQAIGAEGALVYGPFSLQGEYFSYWLDRSAHDKARADGGYIYLSYFLTGENRNYKRTAGAFDRVKPYENFFRVRDEDGYIQMGKGAWELAYRASYLDLNDGSMAGGFVTNHTLGVNWYLNPYTRMMFNYVHSETTGHPDAAGVGVADILQTRVEINF